MGIHYKKANIHWNYFLTIESDFQNISRYIEFTESNNRTFSIELARILMSATQEVDVIMKALCELVEPGSEPKNIDDYRKVMSSQQEEFLDEVVQIPRFEMSSRPWINWKDDQNPDWWKANNKIKHDRTENFQKANLKNTFNAVGGLLTTTLYFYKKKLEKSEDKDLKWTDFTSRLKPRSSFIRLRDDYYEDFENDLEVGW